ncbi:MAG: EAL domain-containing protein [Treponema sp.]|nr:EAL domain-containing protein [Treponema sp.]
MSSIKNFKKSSHKRQLSYALATMALWIGFGVTQIFLPAILISSVGISSMILLMFLSLENPSEYIDRETSTFNHYAFKSVLAEFMAKSDPFTVITLGMDDTKIIESQADNDIIVNLFMLVKKFISKTFRTDIYRISSTSLALIFSEKQWKTAEGKLSALEERFNDGWLVQNRSIHIRAHVNVIRCPEDFSFSEKFSDVLDFIENCDTYSSAKGFIRMGDESARRNKLRQSAIIRLLTKTIETGEIEMFYQPIYSIREKKFTNVEALVRLRDDKSLGYVSPEEFIPLAERNALIMPLSSLIFNRIFKFMHDTEIDKKGVHHMEVNLSGLQSVDTEFPVLMKDLLTKYAINPENVNLEVTESIAITSGYMLKKNMDELRKFGCSFSMDDFGTGYSNLSQISKVDFEVIKIDKSLLWPCFQKNAGDTGNAKILLETMINMILQMGRKIVVEGIETKEQFDYLASLGVNYAQGYYFSRPVPENAYLKFLADNS